MTPITLLVARSRRDNGREPYPREHRHRVAIIERRVRRRQMIHRLLRFARGIAELPTLHNPSFPPPERLSQTFHSFKRIIRPCNSGTIVSSSTDHEVLLQGMYTKEDTCVVMHYLNATLNHSIWRHALGSLLLYCMIYCVISVTFSFSLVSWNANGMCYVWINFYTPS